MLAGFKTVDEYVAAFELEILVSKALIGFGGKLMDL